MRWTEVIKSLPCLECYHVPSLFYMPLSIWELVGYVRRREEWKVWRWSFSKQKVNSYRLIAYYWMRKVLYKSVLVLKACIKRCRVWCPTAKHWIQLGCLLKNVSTSSVSPPGLSLEHTELGIEALSPRINWIKINPIWNVHLILWDDVSNICKRFLY